MLGGSGARRGATLASAGASPTPIRVAGSNRADPSPRFSAMPFRFIAALVALFAVFTTASSAQESHASSQFFHQVVGNELRGVWRVEVEDGFHIYHSEVGPGFAQATAVEFSAEGVTFGPLVLPAPEAVVQPKLGPKKSDTFVWAHHGVFFATVRGTLAEGAAAPASVAVKTSGQVCDDNGCHLYSESYTSSSTASVPSDVAEVFASADFAANEAHWPWPLAEAQPQVLAALANKQPVEPILAALFVAPPAKVVAEPAPQSAPAVVEERPSSAPTNNPPAQQSGFGFGARQHAYGEFFHRVEGNEVRGVLRFEVDPGFHLYHPTVGPGIAKPTVVTLQAPGVAWNAVVFPEPEATSEGQFGSFVWAHHDTFTVLVTGVLAAGAEAPENDAIVVSVKGQTCDAKGCVDYDDEFASEGDGADDEVIAAVFANTDWKNYAANWPFDLAARETAAYAELGLTPPAVVDANGATDGTATTGTATTGTPDALPAGDTPPPPTDGTGLMGLLALAIGGGLFALVMPCTYPMIPITISFFTKQAEKRGGVVWPLALVYGAGIVSMFTAIGLVVYLLDVFAAALGMEAGDAGSAIIAFAISGWFNLVIAIAFLYFALVLFGAINLNPPQWAMRFVGTAQGKGGVSGLFLMGFLLVITSFTCTGPFVGSILGAAAQQGGGRVVLGMAVFGLTMALPFVLLSLVPGKVSKLPRSGAWMNTVKITLGFVEVAAAIKFLSNADIAWNWGILPRELFFWIWCVVALVIAAFLFGWIKVKGESSEIGPARMTVGLAFALLAAYFGYGAQGNQLGGAMTALAPPYSNRVVNQPKIDRMQQQIDSIHEALSNGAVSRAGGGGLVEKGPIVVLDDIDAAAVRAQKTGRALLINFTGHV
jgi:thiol:disulfide interchange protein DsbD